MAKQANKTEVVTALDIRSAVEGFNPSSLLIDIANRGDPTKTSKYLEVKYRVAWALLWAEQNGIDLRIDDSEVQFMPEAKQVIATCVISDGDKVLTRSTAGKFYDPDNALGTTFTPIQDACTAAKGRALANIGFGTVACALEEGSDPAPCDAGVKLPVNPLAAAASGTLGAPAATVAKENPAPAAAKQAPAPAFQPVEMTLAEAQAVKVSSGKHAGLTMGEIFAIDPNWVAYYAEPDKGLRYPVIKSAARVLLANNK